MIRWHWPGWFQRNVIAVLASEAGCGKTRFLCDLLRRIRHGELWPDGTAMTLPADSRTLWVVSDNNHDELVTVAAEFDITDSIYINAPKTDPFSGTLIDDAPALAALLSRAKVVQPAFIIIDTVGNATDRNLGKQEEAKQFYQPLQVIARQADCALIASTHLNMTGGVLGRRALEKVRTAAIMTKPDPVGQPDRRKLALVKTNSQQPPALGITMRTGGNDYDQTPPECPDSELGRQPAKVKECADWLRNRLLNEPVRLCVLIDEASAKGFSKGTLYRAQPGIAVEQGESRSKFWRLRDFDNVETE